MHHLSTMPPVDLTDHGSLCHRIKVSEVLGRGSDRLVRGVAVDGEDRDVAFVDRESDRERVVVVEEWEGVMCHGYREV